MTQQLHAFFSNQVELLYVRLKQHLFTTESTPFTRRLIVVPCPAMKSWLMLQMARDPDLGIAAALEISYLDQTIRRLEQWLRPVENALQPTHMELALALERKIRCILIDSAKMTSQNKSLWQPLLHYLKIPDTLITPFSALSKKTERRLTMLCDKLAALFLKYGVYGGAMAAEWETETILEWQQRLWCHIFAKPSTSNSSGPVWSYPYREISSLMSLPMPPLQQSNIQIHLFAMSYLPRLQHSFLTHLSSHVPVNYYLLSPCQAFWSDIHSDRESQWLQAYWKRQGISQAQQHDLEGYLQDRNPLLANFGKLGREMARQLEESEIQTFEEYVLAGDVSSYSQYEEFLSDRIIVNDCKHPLTLLEAVQADLALLRAPQHHQKLALENQDDSIQVHIASSRMREVQILYDVLVKLMTTQAQGTSSISPGEIIVMVPNLHLYVPHIKAVFSSKESHLTAQIMDISIAANSSLIQGFLHLIALPFSRWKVTELLKLFDFSAFQTRHQLSREDLHNIREWAKAGGVRWGEDPFHRNELLKRDHCQQGMVEDSLVGTWEHTFERLLFGLVLSETIEPCDTTLWPSQPLENVDSTQGQILGRWICLMRSLREDLACLVDGTCLSLEEWSDYLNCLSESYFSPDDKRSEEDRYTLETHLNTFKQIGSRLGAQPFPFSTVRHHLMAALEGQVESYREHDLSAVRFCSMLPMRAIPAHVVALMGMEEGAFPRQESNLSLNLLKEHPHADYHPSPTDFDRYLFLEALLSARRHLVITYQGYSAADGKEQPPSLLVTELLSYLDKSYTLANEKPSQHCVRIHPIHPFDRMYFSAKHKSNFQSYSQFQYAAAQAYYHTEKKIPSGFIPEFSITPPLVPLNEEEQQLCVSLKELAACARNPIQTYFNRTLGIYLDNADKRILKNEEEFHLTHLQNYFIKKDGLKKPADQLVTRAEREGLLPIGSFKEVAVDRIKKEVTLLQQNLVNLGVQPNDVFTITLSEQCRVPARSEEGHWQVPPLSVNCRGQQMRLVGTLHDVSLQGLISQHKDDRANISKVWPQFLVLNCLIQRYSLPIQNSLLLINHPKGKVKDSFFSDAETLLEHYLDYYFTALQHISPLIPEWVPHLIHDADTFEAKMRDSLTNPFSSIYNDYLYWAVQRGDLPDSQKIMTHWRPIAQQLFSELFQNWYPNSFKNGEL